MQKCKKKNNVVVRTKDDMTVLYREYNFIIIIANSYEFHMYSEMDGDIWERCVPVHIAAKK